MTPDTNPFPSHWTMHCLKQLAIVVVISVVNVVFSGVVVVNWVVFLGF